MVWCLHKEIPHLEKEVWQRFKNDDFILVGVDLKEELSVVEEFIKSTDVTYPFAIDSDGSFESFTIQTGVTRNIVIDKEGKSPFLQDYLMKMNFSK